MPRTREYSAKEVADALREANGVVRQAATKLGCTPKTVYRYADEYVTVEQAMQEARQDLAGKILAVILERCSEAGMECELISS